MLVFLLVLSLMQQPEYEAIQKTAEIYRELATGEYDEEAVCTYGRFATTLLVNHLRGPEVIDDAFIKKLDEPYELRALAEEERGHNPAWVATLKGEEKPFAFFKESIEVKVAKEVTLYDPLCFSSFLSLIPDMPLTTTVTDFEVIGYEMDALFGFNMVPYTIKRALPNGKTGIIQRYVEGGEPIGNFIYQKDRLKELATLSQANLHIACLSGIFKGVGAHHIGNYLMVSKDKRIIDVKEVDLEEIMPPYNRVDKPIVLCRLVLLGLPQATKPLDKALRMILTHPSFQILLERYHKTLSINPACLSAQKERLDIIQKLCRDSCPVTPRDIYFAIFGGRDIYLLAKEKGYPDITCFNNVISDPYQDIVTDIYNPASMKPSTSLEPITDSDSEEDRIRKSNLQAFESCY